MIFQIEPSISAAFEAAKVFSIDNDIYFIDISMIAIGILKTDYNISKIFAADKDEILEELTGVARQYSGTSGKSENIPFTLDLERVLLFAKQYALHIQDAAVETYHILFALLSYDNVVAKILKEHEWLFETFLPALNKIVTLPIETNKLSYPLQPTRSTPFPYWIKYFLPGIRKKEISERLYGELHTLYSFYQYQSCRQLCNVIHDLSGGRVSVGGYMINSFNREKRIQEAIEYYEKFQPKDRIAVFNVALSYRSAGNYSRAIEIYSSIRETTPLLYNNWGFSLCDAGKYQEAIELFDKAIALDASFAYAYNNKGYVLLKCGDIAGAKKLVQQSLSMRKSNSYAYRNLAMIYVAEKNKTAAIAAIDKALLLGYRADYGDDIDAISNEIQNLAD